ncbi:MAG: hypothetical protein ACK2TU_02625, partial [Anaerolineales bacterium]
QLEKDELVNDPFVHQLNIDLNQAKLGSFGEKVYVHLDKPFYVSGETIWFNAYLVNTGSLILTENSGVLYVDLISAAGVNLMHKRLLVKKGLCEGNIDLPEKLESGNYWIRVYTNWMKNYDKALYFNKQIPVYNPTDDLKDKYLRKPEDTNFDVQFFPEGGHLVNNLTSQVAFKAIDSSGKGIEIEGKIVDSKGETVSEFVTRHSGMGSFFMNPQSNKSYKAIVKYKRNEKEFDFPEVMEEGYAISVNNLKDRNIQVMIINTPSLDDTELYIIARIRGMIYHREKVLLKHGSAVVSIPKAKFPDGIVLITFFNDLHIPVCERMVFINSQQIITASLENEPIELEPREKISLKLLVKDQYGKAVRNTSFSLAITDADHLIKDNTRETIKSNLLLSSDLKGTIEDPGYYFLEDDRDTRIALDLVMLTHGWSRYSWKEISDGDISVTTYPHESGIDIRGIASNMGNKPISNAFLKFVPLNYNFFGLWETTTGIDGKFELKGMILPDSTLVVVKYTDERGRNANAKLQLDIPDLVMPNESMDPGFVFQVNDKVLHYMDLYRLREIAYSMNDVEEKVVLKEIVIEDSRIQDRPIYGEPDNIIKVDNILENYGNIFEVIRGRVPGVQVYGEGLDTQVRIRGTSTFSGD